MFYANSLSTMPEERVIRAGFTGTGANAPTIRAGNAFSVTRSGVGVWRVSFLENPGKFVGLDGFVFRATTMSAVKGYSLSCSDYTAPASGVKGYIDVSLWDSANAAVDLAASQWLDLVFVFTGQSRLT